MSLDSTNLLILKQSGTPKEKEYAEKIEPIRRHGHWVLSTLLLGNVVVNETLPIVFHGVVGGGVAAVVVSTFLVVLFGEIIPNAICARHGLAIGATLAPVVKFFMYIFYPIAYPIGLLLDSILGTHAGTVYERDGLKTLVSLHEQHDSDSDSDSESGSSQASDGKSTPDRKSLLKRKPSTNSLNSSKPIHHHPGILSHDQVAIISHVLDMSDKTALSAMTPLTSVYSLSINQPLDTPTVKEIVSRGVSRIPVYQATPQNLVAMLLSKKLIGYNVEKVRKVSDFGLTYLPIVDGATGLGDMLNFFQEGKSHMAAVAALCSDSDEREIVGIITLEDVIEELIGEEIVDETDQFVDVSTREPVVRTAMNTTMAKLIVSNIRRNWVVPVDVTSGAKEEGKKDVGGSVGESTPLLGGGGSAPHSRSGSILKVGSLDERETRGRSRGGSRRARGMSLQQRREGRRKGRRESYPGTAFHLDLGEAGRSVSDSGVCPIDTKGYGSVEFSPCPLPTPPGVNALEGSGWMSMPLNPGEEGQAGPGKGKARRVLFRAANRRGSAREGDEVLVEGDDETVGGEEAEDAGNVGNVTDNAGKKTEADEAPTDGNADGSQK
ncbi:hypothetical protein HK097_008838 [Rhizophlyctis rosea]|uniref:CNNM transmembrane domain-containing protein n=1 Tax=Rhizophlyctis rosea TaxID=64517 RepID=A0AAD5SBD9_9FUNG|nr:hypothetical protein HK097_008838 [Rhizophlyctis rosea]